MQEVPILNHEKLDAYRAAIDMLALAHQVVGRIPRGHGPMAEQLRRASLSIPLNISGGMASVRLLIELAFMTLRVDQPMSAAHWSTLRRFLASSTNRPSSRRRHCYIVLCQCWYEWWTEPDRRRRRRRQRQRQRGGMTGSLFTPRTTSLPHRVRIPSRPDRPAGRSPVRPRLSA